MSGKIKNPIKPGDGDPRHGTSNGYNNHGCRCLLCREANKIAHFNYMHGDPERLVRHAARQRAARKNLG